MEQSTGFFVFTNGVFDQTAKAPNKTKMKIPPILLAAPVYGNAPIASIDCFYATINEHRVSALKFNTGDSLVSRARNNLVADFLLTKFEAIMFVDSDIIFSPDHVTALWKHIEAGHSIVAGLYPIKQISPLRWCVNAMPGAVQRPDGLIAAREAGTGFLMIHRRVFEAIAKDHPERAYKCDMDKRTKYDFFRVGVLDGRYMSEDWFFCHDAREAGFEVMADSSVITEHIGTVNYPIQEPQFETKP